MTDQLTVFSWFPCIYNRPCILSFKGTWVMDVSICSSHWHNSLLLLGKFGECDLTRRDLMVTAWNDSTVGSHVAICCFLSHSAKVALNLEHPLGWTRKLGEGMDARSPGRCIWMSILDTHRPSACLSCMVRAVCRRARGVSCPPQASAFIPRTLTSKVSVNSLKRGCPACTHALSQCWVFWHTLAALSRLLIPPPEARWHILSSGAAWSRLWGSPRQEAMGYHRRV